MPRLTRLQESTVVSDLIAFHQELWQAAIDYEESGGVAVSPHNLAQDLAEVTRQRLREYPRFPQGTPPEETFPELARLADELDVPEVEGDAGAPATIWIGMYLAMMGSFSTVCRDGEKPHAVFGNLDGIHPARTAHATALFEHAYMEPAREMLRQPRTRVRTYGYELHGPILEQWGPSAYAFVRDIKRVDDALSQAAANLVSNNQQGLNLSTVSFDRNTVRHLRTLHKAGWDGDDGALFLATRLLESAQHEDGQQVMTLKHAETALKVAILSTVAADRSEPLRPEGLKDLTDRRVAEGVSRAFHAHYVAPAVKLGMGLA